MEVMFIEKGISVGELTLDPSMQTLPHSDQRAMAGVNMFKNCCKGQFEFATRGGCDMQGVK